MQELIINKDPTLLDNFLDVSGDGSGGWSGTDPGGAGWIQPSAETPPPSPHCVMSPHQEIIAFQADKSIEVRKFVVGFIEEAW